MLSNLTWYQRDTYIVGIDLNLDPLIIADCLSATYDIPLESIVQFSPDFAVFSVNQLEFIRVPKPKHTGRYDKIQTIAFGA